MSHPPVSAIINPGDRMILGAMGREAHSRSGCAKSPRSYAWLLKAGSFRGACEGSISSSPSTGEDKGEDHPPGGSIGRIECRRPSVVASAETRPGLLPTTNTTHSHTYTQLYSCRAARSLPYRGVDVAIISLDPPGETRRHLLDEQHHAA